MNVTRGVNQRYECFKGSQSEVWTLTTEPCYSLYCLISMYIFVIVSLCSTMSYCLILVHPHVVLQSSDYCGCSCLISFFLVFLNLPLILLTFTDSTIKQIYSYTAYIRICCICLNFISALWLFQFPFTSLDQLRHFQSLRDYELLYSIIIH